METTENQQPVHLTLEQFCSQIKYAIDQSRLEAWVTAETVQVSVSNGHYYIDLAQKSEFSDYPSAKLRCIIWRTSAALVLTPFREATGSDIGAGMKILAYIRVNYHPAFGLSGLILGIDPSYTLGDIEAQRRAIWARLVAEGVADMNKALDLPMVIKRIAVVSARTAAGYGDFMNQLSNNDYGIAFHTELFEARVQGADAEASVVSALERVAERAEEFDVVVVIRGGGSKMDLACFDSYDIACNIAQFPLPVITGIGHERDRSIADMVAHTQVKTPTAAAEFLIAHNADFLVILDELERRVVNAAGNELNVNKTLMENLSIRLLSAAKDVVSTQKSGMEMLRSRITMAANQMLAHAKQMLSHDEMRVTMAARMEVEREKTMLTHTTERIVSAAGRAVERKRLELDGYAQRLKASDPRAVLARGFSMTTGADGRLLKSAGQVAAGDEIVTHLGDGEVTSVVK